MATLTVRNVPEEAKHRFRQVAAAHGRSMEEHLRRLVIEADLETPSPLQGVRDVTHSFHHFKPAVDEPFVSSGSPVIDRLIKSGRGLEFEPPPRELERFEPVFDPKDFL